MNRWWLCVGVVTWLACGPVDGECDLPRTQVLSQPCCLKHGADACGAELYCAAFDGRSQATCYPEHGRGHKESCLEDKHCESYLCDPNMNQCAAVPGGPCEDALGCGRAGLGDFYFCDEGTCAPSPGQTGDPCGQDTDCAGGGVCEQGVCVCPEVKVCVTRSGRVLTSSDGDGVIATCDTKDACTKQTNPVCTQGDRGMGYCTSQCLDDAGCQLRQPETTCVARPIACR